MTDDTMPLPTQPEPDEVLLALETLLRAGFAVEIASILARLTVKKEKP